MKQFTLSIIKPDAVRKGLNQQINEYIERQDLKIERHKAMILNIKQASEFYYMHRSAPFFPNLLSLMTSGPMVVQLLSGNDAINVYRKLMGHTDPKKAEPGTIRGDLAETIDENCVHGSDSEDSATREIPFFFAGYELI